MWFILRVRAMTTMLDGLFKIRRPQPGPLVTPGVHAYTRDGDDHPRRLHLRADESGGGVLVANAALAARLSAAGVFLAKNLLDGHDPAKVVSMAQEHFTGATERDVRNDIARLQALIDDAGHGSSAYPVSNLGDSIVSGGQSVLEKPIVADVPFTAGDGYEALLRRLWDQGIVHAVFVLPERFEHAPLVRLVELAEDLGMIAGVRGAAAALAGGTLVEDLARAGIDHVNIFYVAADQALHDGLLGAGDHALAHATFKRLRDNEVCPVGEIPLLEQNLPAVWATLEQLIAHGVNNVAFFVIASDAPADADRHGALTPDDLLQTAATVEEAVEMRGLMATWYAPVLRDPGIQTAEQIRRGPRASGDNAVQVMVDGTVFAARGARISAGNVLQDDWADIQAGVVYSRYVGRITTPTRCPACPGLVICAADCPRARSGWSDDTAGSS